MKRRFVLIHRISFFGFIALLVIISITLMGSKNISCDTMQINHLPGKTVVVMELFTSQGCSSCPPADALLAEYAGMHNENIIALSFHVDYWNRLGWKDPFSSKYYSERQEWYSRYLPNGSVYTPQLLVNGRREAVGNNRNAVKTLVQEANSESNAETISIENVSVENESIRFHYTTTNTGKEEVINIALVQKKAITYIKSGENEGVTITNHNIVRTFETQNIAKEGTGKINLPASFKAAEYALVVYVQNKNNLSITTALMKDL